MWNLKSMTGDDPMKFGFGSPAIKKAFKLLCNSSKYMKTTSNSPNRSQKCNRAFRTEVTLISFL
ncbi:hypothetical protein YC2023_058744 [Brassica napus]